MRCLDTDDDVMRWPLGMILFWDALGSPIYWTTWSSLVFFTKEDLDLYELVFFFFCSGTTGIYFFCLFCFSCRFLFVLVTFNFPCFSSPDVQAAAPESFGTQCCQKILFSALNPRADN